MTTVEQKPTPSVLKKILQGDLILVIVLAVEIIVMSLLSNKFFTVYNLLNMTRNFVEIGIVSLSMTFVILTSGIDLSVGSLVGMNAMILGTLSIRSGINIWMAAIIVIAVSVLAGFVNGTVITRIKVPPLVVTLATMSMFRGLAYSVSDAKTFSGFPESFSVLGQGTLFNTKIPVQLLIFAALALVFFVIMKYTRFGRNVYVIGNNEKTALFSGINVNRVKVILYILSGLLCGIASIIMVSRVSAARADLATGFELDVITAVLVGGVHALRDVSVTINKGKVHVIAGENGAGKSTFIKILAGVHQPNDGKVFVDGKEVEQFNPYNAIQAGIAPIFQESSVYENQTVIENVFVVNKIKKKNSPFLDWRKMERMCNDIFRELEEDINVQDNLIKMTAGRKKIIEIARALVQDAKCVIMDEPTSSLSEKEIDKLFKQIQTLKERGIAIIYITHKLDEIYEIGDSISVFRDGSLAGTENVKSLERDKLIKMMIDRTLEQYFPEIPHEIGEPVLEIRNITSEYGLFHDVSFTVHKGEILGLYGLVGAGRSELAQAVFGIDRNKHGEIKLNGKKCKVPTATRAISNGIAYLPEDRQSQGLVVEMDVKSNITLAVLKKLVNFFFINRKKELEITEASIKRLHIMTTGPEQIVNNLSGGNQQKVLVSKWLNVEPDVLILDEPTRGIDVGTKTEIYNLIKSLAERGIAILLISSELQEILGMSQRVIVMNSGSIVSRFEKDEISKEKIIKAALKEQI